MRTKVALLAGAALALTNVAVAQDNEADVETVGTNANVSTIQNGLENNIGSESGDPGRIFTVDGDRNFVRLEQNGSNNIIGRWDADVLGERGEVRISQAGDNNDVTDMRQSGLRNELRIQQAGVSNRVRFARQSGERNEAIVRQDGSFNGRTSSISDFGNTVFWGTLGSGSDEDASGALRQSGDNGFIRIEQNGTENGFWVNQSGDRNEIRINQNGLGNHAAVWQDGGSSNEARIIQSGQDNRAALYQIGAGNVVRIEQNG